MAAAAWYILTFIQGGGEQYLCQEHNTFFINGLIADWLTPQAIPAPLGVRVEHFFPQFEYERALPNPGHSIAGGWPVRGQKKG